MPDYIIKPYDVLFFRGNKSFHFGQWYTEGIFPPYPSTFQGFVRSKILFDNDFVDSSGKLKDRGEAEGLVGNDKEVNVNIVGPYLMNARTGDIYFRTPADLLRKDPQCDTCYSAFPTAEHMLESDLGFKLSCPNIPEGKLDRLTPPEFISLEKLISYRTSLEEISIPELELLGTEDRVGIGLDFEKLARGSRAVQETRFCVTPYNRLKNDIGFYCHVDKRMEEGSLKLGSESHLVYVEELGKENIIKQCIDASRKDLIPEIVKTKTFRMILLQHGIFPQGWMPFDFNEVDGRYVSTGEIEGLKLELVFAFTGAPVKISGYSFTTNKDPKEQVKINLKPLINAVPAGSVYMFRILNECDTECVENFIERYDNEKIKNEPYEHYSKMGFNHVMLGIGNKF